VQLKHGRFTMAGGAVDAAGARGAGIGF
jgi:hypothetical protein